MPWFESYADMLIKIQRWEYSTIHARFKENFILSFTRIAGQIDGQNAYNQVSDTFIDYKQKLRLCFLVLESNDAIIQLSWGIEGDS